jgi:hypothetical protein
LAGHRAGVEDGWLMRSDAAVSPRGGLGAARRSGSVGVVPLLKPQFLFRAGPTSLYCTRPLPKSRHSAFKSPLPTFCYGKPLSCLHEAPGRDTNISRLVSAGCNIHRA